MRGKVPEELELQLNARITPAYAGKSVCFRFTLLL